MNIHTKHPRRGAALIMALTMLALFTVLGTLYVSNMSTELSRADRALREARARQTAQAGIEAAVGELERAPELHGADGFGHGHYLRWSWARTLRARRTVTPRRGSPQAWNRTHRKL